MYDMTIRLRTDSDKCLYQGREASGRREASLHAFFGRISAGGQKYGGLCL